MAVVATLKDGRVIARTALTSAGRSASGEIVLAPVSVTDLRQVEYLLQVNLTKANDAGASVSPHGFAATGNRVGLTVYASAGVTVGGEIILVGY